MVVNNMEYIKINSENDCVEADKLLNDLIKYESNFDDVINGKCTIKDFHKSMLDKSNVFAYYVKDNGSAVGYIFAYLKTPYNDVIKTNVVMLESLYIKEEYRKNGLGRTLIEMLEKWAKETLKDYSIEIVCLSKNKEALKFYDKLGYSEVKTILRK